MAKPKVKPGSKNKPSREKKGSKGEAKSRFRPFKLVLLLMVIFLAGILASWLFKPALESGNAPPPQPAAKKVSAPRKFNREDFWFRLQKSYYGLKLESRSYLQKVRKFLRLNP